jgi:hypothetical protein
MTRERPNREVYTRAKKSSMELDRERSFTLGTVFHPHSHTESKIEIENDHVDSSACAQ